MAKSISLRFIGRMENSRSWYLISKTTHRKCRLRPRNGKSQFQRVLLKSAFSLRNSRILAQQFVRLDDIAFTVAFMGINYPPPTKRSNRATIAPSPSGGTELVSDYFPVFHLKMARFSLGEFAQSGGKKVLPSSPAVGSPTLDENNISDRET